MTGDRDDVRGSPIGRMKVSKKIHPGERGAIKLVRKHGDRAVCVRYRIDEAGTRRYTTIDCWWKAPPFRRSPSSWWPFEWGSRKRRCTQS